MRTMHTADGDISVYVDDLGKPCIKCGNFFLSLVPQHHKNASRLRIKQGFAVSLADVFNFKRVMIAPVFDGNELVFLRFNGQEMFRLKVAHQ